MHKNINHIIRKNYINSKSVNTIHNFKEETKMDNPSSHSGMLIHEFSKYTKSPLIHILPTYIRYRIITGTNRTCNITRVYLPKTSILKHYTT